MKQLLLWSKICSISVHETPSVSTSFFPVLALKQKPLQHTCVEEFNYFVSTGINSLELHDIYEVEKTEETGGMDVNLDLRHIYLSNQEGYFSDNWHCFYDSSDAVPVLDTLVKFLDETFVNGIEWQFDNGELNMSGGHGYGTLSMTYYEYLDTVVLKNRVTMRSDIEELGITTFYGHGLPKQFIGWKTIDLSEEDVDDTYNQFDLDFLSTSTNLDTTLYTYDENLKITSIKELRSQNEILQLFTPLDPQRPALFHQCYIGLELFEKRMHTITGTLPLTVVFEINPLHVFAFKLDASTNTYHFSDTYELL